MKAIPRRMQIGVAALCATAAALVFFKPGPPQSLVPAEVLPNTSANRTIQDHEPELHQQGELGAQTTLDPAEELLERAKDLARKDLSSAFALIEEEGPPDRRPRMRSLLAKAVVRNNPSALSAVLALLPNRERSSVVGWLAAEAVKTDAVGALAAIEAHLSGEMKIKALSGAIDQLARQGDFTLAIAKQREIPSMAAGSRSFGSLARELSKANVPGFVDWVQTLPKADADRAISTARNALAEGSNDAALELLLPLTEDEHIRRNLIQSLIDIQVKRGGTNDAKRFLATLEPSEREIGTGAILVASKDVPLDVAIPQVLTFDNPIALHSTVTGLVRRECENDIRRVADYALRAPKAAEDAVLNALVQIWDREDSAELEEWINRLPNDRIRDKSLKHLANSLRYSGPDARSRARELAERIRDPEIRSESMRKLSQ